VRVSDTDYRAYRTLTLETGLEVLLVQDERASKAAAALALPVGSLDNPDSQPGLAHYLEHMLFLGSESYPGPEEYQSFITRNGGQTNAATGYTSTTYMMEVDPPAFAEALRRMADTLARPAARPGLCGQGAKRRQRGDGIQKAQRRTPPGHAHVLDPEPGPPGHALHGRKSGDPVRQAGQPPARRAGPLSPTWYSANLMKGRALRPPEPG
jgi:protease III